MYSENSYASRHKKRPRGPRSTRRPGAKQNQDLVIHRPLVDLRTKAILYFSHHYLQTSSGILSFVKGVTNDFLPIWQSKGECRILDHAVSSVALAVYARAQQESPASTQACAAYHQLLRLQRNAITDLNKDSIDACLIAIFFMSRFEDVVNFTTYPKVRRVATPQMFPHHDGALAILKFWRQHLIHQHPATESIKYTRRGMIRSATLRNRPLPDWILDGSEFGERDADFEYDSISVRIVNIRHRVSLLLDNEDKIYTETEQNFSLDELYHDALKISKTLQDWAYRFLNTRGYRQHSLSNTNMNFLPSRYFYSSVVYSYSTTAQASSWILYYSTLMLITSTILKILDGMNSSSQPLTKEQRLQHIISSSNMDSLANDMASTLPFSLERFTLEDRADAPPPQYSIKTNEDDDVKPFVANMIIWPLSLAVRMRGVDVKYSIWFKSLLARLGRITGYAILESAETDAWPQL